MYSKLPTNLAVGTDSAKMWNVISSMQKTALIKCHNYLAKTKKSPKHY